MITEKIKLFKAVFRLIASLVLYFFTLYLHYISENLYIKKKKKKKSENFIGRANGTL